MSKFIPYVKLSKKERKKLNDSKRIMWSVPPTPKVIPNKKKDSKEFYS